MPPKETSLELSDVDLALQVLEALDEYCSLGRAIYASEWEEINNNLIKYFGCRSISQFERLKRGVTVRQEYGSDSIVVFTDNDEEISVPISPEILGSKLKQLFR
ncbi:hypothetical protein E4634_20960 [Mangrovimicrobium sediminis]|uniref:Uncharacterized protein n=2 Tax=Mangrovimicrobium sediminis TaxID=2562682 RepID=A0A4Z0LTR6_9GAMM|nr:hypothetical protein E4634_20960 [Haliea sp. SAOS-164]